MVKMVGSMLAIKPADPVPFMYSYILELQKGFSDKDVKPITDNELNEMKNL
jgi:cAMP-dependent protein kinase regulator